MGSAASDLPAEINTNEEAEQTASEILAQEEESLKRTSSELQDDNDAAIAEKRQKTSPTTARKVKNPPPPKKLNNEQWEAMFQRLQAYRSEHGDCLVPKRYAKDPKLGTWVETQRVQYKKLQRASEDGDSGTVTPNKRLNAERLEKLEAIGFAWSAKNLRKPKQATAQATKKKASTPMDVESRAAARNRMSEMQWNTMYDRLVAYKELHGNTLVPKKYEPDQKLASWVETQRVLYNRDYRKSPPSETAATATELPTATVQAKTTEEWVQEFEKTDIPLETATEEDVAAVVEATMEVVDTLEDSKPGAIEEDAAVTPETVVEMTAIDEVMEQPPEELVATSEIPDESVEAVAAAAAAAAVAMEVAEMPAVTDGIHVPDTEYQYDPASVHTPTDESNGVVIASPAATKPQKRLTEERKAKLDALGFVWNLRSKRVDDHWDEMFERLLNYKHTHGDCLVPSRYEQDVKLGKWVETQRYEYTKLQRVHGGKPEGAKKEETTSAEDKAEASDTPAKTARPTNPRLTEERLRRLESIGFEWKVKHKMKRYYDRQWDAMYERLLEYKQTHGNCLVPKRYPPDMKLGTWVHTQRIQYQKFLKGTSAKKSASPTETEETKAEEETYRLTQDRRKRLEEAGFVWSARETEKNSEPSRITRNSYDDQWDAMFQRLVAYKEKNGSCLVPKRCKEDPKLGTWVDTQRVQYKKMRKKLASMGVEYEGPSNVELPSESPDGINPPTAELKPLVGRLTDDRIRRLEDLGFVWSLRDDWQKHYEELKEYKKQHGHCNVPARYRANRRLGIWVSAQRQQYKILNKINDRKPRRTAPLTMARVNLLNELGFTWTIRSRDSLGESWNMRLEELKLYKEEHGNCLVPSRYPANPELGVWVGTQRTQYRLYMKAKEGDQSISQSSAMNEDRIRQLEELGFVWALRGGSDNAWRKRVAELAQYRDAHGHCDIPAGYNAWVDQQREQYKLWQEGKPSLLDPEKVAELDLLGFGWDAPAMEQQALDPALDPAATSSVLATVAVAQPELVVTEADTVQPAEANGGAQMHEPAAFANVADQNVPHQLPTNSVPENQEGQDVTYAI